MKPNELFDKIYPRKEYREDGWIYSYDRWKEDCVAFAEKYEEQNKPLTPKVSNKEIQEYKDNEKLLTEFVNKYKLMSNMQSGIVIADFLKQRKK